MRLNSDSEKWLPVIKNKNKKNMICNSSIQTKQPWTAQEVVTLKHKTWYLRRSSCCSLITAPTRAYRIPQVKFFSDRGFGKTGRWGTCYLRKLRINRSSQLHCETVNNKNTETWKSTIVQQRDAANKLGLYIKTSVQTTEIMPFQHGFLYNPSS